MKFAVIAAGEGSRLRHEGISIPKPLVKIAGEPMIDRLLRIFSMNGADEIIIIVNSIYPDVERHLRSITRNEISSPLKIVVQDTPSSMHSLGCISSYLSDSPFCLTTVDTIFDESEFAKYIHHFEHSHYDGCMAVTDYVDDESPLYIKVDESHRILAFNDTHNGETFISGGIYCLRPNALSTLDRCLRSGKSRMRNFQRGLIEDGLTIEAYPFSKILDIDHAGDILKAESFILQKDQK